MSKKNFAFSLAETLIALGIVGVIAAISIPLVKATSDEAQHVAAAKVAYSQIQKAVSLAELTYGDIVLWDWNNLTTVEVNERFKTVMKSVKLKKVHDVYDLSGNKLGRYGDDSGYWFYTTNGMLWQIAKGNSVKAVVWVDTNGSSPPNVVGVDFLSFGITKDGVGPSGSSIYNNSKYNCTNYIIKHGKMPWLKDRSYKDCSDSRISQ